MSKRSKLFLGGGVAAVALIAAVAGGFWYFVLRDDAPAAASIEGALDSLESPSPTETADGSASATATDEAAASTSTAAPGASGSTGSGSVDGTWTVDTGQDTFAGYRVVEELVNFGVTTAVGRTPAVTGEVVIAENTVTAASFEADMTQLQSDRSQRDGQLRTQAIETNTYPTSTFVLTEEVALPETLAEGEVIDVTLVGDFTLHGVTRSIELPAQATRTGEYLIVVGSIDIVFADYDIDPPQSFSVVSVEDHGIMEVQLFLTQS